LRSQAENPLDTQLSLFPPVQPVSEKRDEPRKRLVWAATLVGEAGSFPCTILDVTRNGAKLQLSAPILSRLPIELVIESLGSLGVDVVWQLDDMMGVRFRAAPDQVASVFKGVLEL